MKERRKIKSWRSFHDLSLQEEQGVRQSDGLSFVLDFGFTNETGMDEKIKRDSQRLCNS